jgi:nucleoside-diphosphate-sugar epimerase
MNIVVFGANGPTGRLVTGQALQAGHRVTAFTRRPDSFPISHTNLAVVGGDVHDAQAVARVIENQDAVLSTLGVPYGKEKITVYSDGTANIIAGMLAHGVGRLVCVSSSATDPGAGPHGGWFFEHVLQAYVAGVLGKTLYDDMRRMEALVSASELDWTIVRPSGLFDAGVISDYATAEAHLPGRFTARDDLADCVLRQADDSAFSRKTIAVTTRDGAPSLLQMIAREAFGKKG